MLDAPNTIDSIWPLARYIFQFLLGRDRAGSKDGHRDRPEPAILYCALIHLYAAAHSEPELVMFAQTMGFSIP